MTHTLLVANDFPPKHGGIQTYLYELVRRLPPSSITVLTTPHADAEPFDAAHAFRIVRDPSRILFPTGALARRINALAAEVGATALVIDPPMPLGLLHRRLALPYAVVLHGGVVGQARLPGVRRLLSGVLTGARGVITAGEFTAAEARRAAPSHLPPVTVIPPGVDVDRFRPLDEAARVEARRSFDIPVEGHVVLGLSRLVPRKGFDVLIDAVATVQAAQPDVVLVIAGGGRDRGRLEQRARERGVSVRFLGRVPDGQLPLIHGCADVFAMPCRNRWGGLEQEGFGIVYLEAAACAVPQVAGRSGGAAEAVVDGETGLVVDDPTDVAAVAHAITTLLDDPSRAARMGRAGRRRAEQHFAYDVLAPRLATAVNVGG